MRQHEPFPVHGKISRGLYHGDFRLGLVRIVQSYQFYDPGALGKLIVHLCHDGNGPVLHFGLGLRLPGEPGSGRNFYIVIEIRAQRYRQCRASGRYPVFKTIREIYFPLIEIDDPGLRISVLVINRYGNVAVFVKFRARDDNGPFGNALPFHPDPIVSVRCSRDQSVLSRIEYGIVH